jgi:AraC-like DNA-binding protein
MHRERPPRPELRRHVSCVWFERAGDRDHVLPDGFVDLVFGRSLWVRGPDTRRHGIETVPGSAFVGVRFRPGAAPFVLGMPASELTDSRVFLRELWGPFADELTERMAAASDPAAVLETALARRAGATDPAVDAVVGHLQRGGSSAALAERVGLGERQLRRRTVSALGYGAKTLERILRFQRFLTLAGTRPLAQLAPLAGYADQPHLTRECRRLAGETPRALAA